MTATIKPPKRARRHRKPPIRFSSMESLGFSNPSSVWSDSPIVPTPAPGRHIDPNPVPDSLADWQPEEFEDRLSTNNIRWSVLVTAFVLLAAAGGVGLWLYQRPAAQAEASVAAATLQAEDLLATLPALQTFNEALLGTGEGDDPTSLFAVDAAARALFDVSGDLDASAGSARSAAASASGAALDGVRLAGDARSYRVAVVPILVPPELETDPNLIELDEAARNFGSWQLRFDDVRTALPDGVLTATTEQLDVLSGDLASILTQYVDTLREDDQVGAQAVLTTLVRRLADVDEQMTRSLIEAQERVADRIVEAEAALTTMLGR